jgi:5-methylcytosine-specific restriction endonuclease McrA
MNTRFDYIKELTLKDYWNKKSLSNLHASSKNAHIRALARSNFKDLVKKPCANCGYDKHVELCHIKPIKEFNADSKIKDVNSYENLIQLCPNCHWEFDNGLLKKSRVLDSNQDKQT